MAYIVKNKAERALGPKANNIYKVGSGPRMKISVSTDISVLGFYGYIGYIGDISVDIFT